MAKTVASRGELESGVPAKGPGPLDPSCVLPLLAGQRRAGGQDPGEGHDQEGHEGILSPAHDELCITLGSKGDGPSVPGPS